MGFHLVPNKKLSVLQKALKNLQTRHHTYKLTDELDAEQTEGEEACLLLGGVDERRDDGGGPLPQRVLLLPLGHVFLNVFLQSG